VTAEVTRLAGHSLAAFPFSPAISLLLVEDQKTETRGAPTMLRSDRSPVVPSSRSGLQRAGRALAVGGCCLLLAAGAARAAAPNLVANGGFDSSLAGWDLALAPNSAVWQPTDAAGLVGSGGVRLVTSVFQVSIFKCIPVTAGKSYVFGASTWRRTPQDPDGIAEAQLSFYGNTSCDAIDLPLAFEISAPATSQERWIPIAGVANAPPGAQTARMSLVLRKAGFPNGLMSAWFDNAFAREGNCAPGANTLCLNDGRFAVVATWRTASGASGTAGALSFSDDSGSLWFFAADNAEVVVKVLDACALNSRFWVLAGGVTSVKVDLLVTDTRTGVSRIYRNPQGTPFAPIQDTSAFATCP